jgi:GntR family transcriptional regulator / MocR family aminotransferase
LKRRRKSLTLTLRINPKSACPLYRQLYNQLRQSLLEQKVPAGARLPSTRVLARTLGVSRNTVLTAYDFLAADALIVARKGSGTHVRTPNDDVRPLATPIRPPFDLSAALREALFPSASVWLHDAEGNPVYFHR